MVKTVIVAFVIDPLTWKGCHRVPGLQKEIPEILIRIRFLRETSSHTDDGDVIISRMGDARALMG